MNPLARYARWLHTRWPAGTVEKLPVVNADGSTNVPGLYSAGDLTGIPLLKFACDTGARVARTIAARGGRAAGPGALDLAIVGAGVSGMAAAIEARRLGLRIAVIEASEPFTTIANFPRAKPIYTYPLDMTPAGELQVAATIKEALLAELRDQAARAGIDVTHARVERIERQGGAFVVHAADLPPIPARAVLVAIGRSGDFRRLDVPGEHLPKVFNRLHDPNDFAGRNVLVVGGGDSALEAASALAESGACTTIAYRGEEWSRPKRENVARLVRSGAEIRLPTQVREIRERDVVLDSGDALPNDVVFTMLGRAAPLDFLRRAGVRIANEMTARSWAAFAALLLFAACLYNWKSGGALYGLWQRHGWFPFTLDTGAHDPRTLLGTLAISAAQPAFWYTVAYSLVVVVFGVRRIRRRRTPYVTAQTLTLMLIQVIPLFLLPEIVLPLLDHNGLLPRGLADALFPVVSYGHGREFWRAYGLILAWPLNVYDVFTHDPLWWWLGISFVQTCVLIPLAIYFFGKGAYCGWVCSCGALAETLGDTHRHKMPHGPAWNRLNMIGQGVLAIAIAMLVVRVIGWIGPDGNWADRVFDRVLLQNYKWGVDVFLAGVIGYGAYFWFSGRVWCRFACPLAALMHVYARVSRFRILADKKKCISCNVCTSVCHQGIDVMSFANKGLPMEDPECVRCSACVQMCPTGVLQFGQVNRAGRIVSVDSLVASRVSGRTSAPPPSPA